MDGANRVGTGNQYLGEILTAADLNDYGRTEPAAGDPSYRCAEDESIYVAGAVMVLPGSPTGLTGQGRQFWAQDSAGVHGTEAPEHLAPLWPWLSWIEGAALTW